MPWGSQSILCIRFSCALASIGLIKPSQAWQNWGTWNGTPLCGFDLGVKDAPWPASEHFDKVLELNLKGITLKAFAFLSQRYSPLPFIVFAFQNKILPERSQSEKAKFRVERSLFPVLLKILLERSRCRRKRQKFKRRVWHLCSCFILRATRLTPKTWTVLATSKNVERLLIVS